ncbi:phage major capsid protein [uncultured Maricaulis sp.]|uniref:phage major capsid protein n=1 Tax=uncultured Maricaulis sp. TaxID=174710 RepID=UPI0030D847B4
MILPAICAGAAFTVLADWTDAKGLREELGELYAEVEAIAQVAEQEGRPLSKEDEQRIDKILGSGEPGDEDHVPGLVHKKQSQIDRQEKIESARNRITEGARGRATVPPQGGQDDDADEGGGGIIDRVRVPVNVVRPKLQAVKSHATAEENYRAAYAIGQFGLAMINQRAASIEWCQDHGLIKGGLTEGTPADGGYLVPSELANSIIYVRDMHGVFRKEARVVPMMSDTKDVAVQTSGLAYTFTAEGIAHTESKPVFSNVALVAKKPSCIAKFSDELGEDAIVEIGDMLARDLGEALAKAEDDCGFIGDGTATYGSMTGVSNALTGLKGLLTAGTPKSDFSDVTNAHFRNMIKQIPGRYRKGCRWYCNETVFDAAMGPILDAAGGNTIRELENGEKRIMFKGYPFVPVASMPEAEDLTTGDRPIVFGNLRAGALLGDRRRISIKKSEERYFETDETAIKGSSRFHAKVHAVGSASKTGAFTVMQVLAV